MTTTQLTVRALVDHAVGGGWGTDEPGDGRTEVAVIRGADFPAVEVGDATGLPVRWEEERKVPQRTLCAGDIVLEISGGTNERPTGRSVLITERLLSSIGRTAIPASFCRLVRVDPEVADPHFVYWWLQGMYADGRTWAYQNRSTGIANFQFEYFLDTEVVTLPSLREQRSIAATLGALNNKIESNLRKLRILDKLLRMHWLQASQRAERRVRLGDIVSTQYGLTASAEAGALGPKFLRVTDINKQNWIQWASVPTVSINDEDLKKYQLKQGDILVARMADPGKSAMFDDEAVTAVFASYLVRLSPGSYAEALYIYGFLKSSLYREHAEATTTGSVQRNMNAKVIVDVEIPWPSLEVVHEFAGCVSGLRVAMNHCVRENDRLRSVRDAVLPELLSGRMRVAEAELEVDSHTA